MYTVRTLFQQKTSFRKISRSATAGQRADRTAASLAAAGCGNPCSLKALRVSLVHAPLDVRSGSLVWCAATVAHTLFICAIGSGCQFMPGTAECRSEVCFGFTLLGLHLPATRIQSVGSNVRRYRKLLTVCENIHWKTMNR